MRETFKPVRPRLTYSMFSPAFSVVCSVVSAPICGPTPSLGRAYSPVTTFQEKLTRRLGAASAPGVYLRRRSSVPRLGMGSDAWGRTSITGTLSGVLWYIIGTLRPRGRGDLICSGSAVPDNFQ